MHLLLINPNSSAATTALMLDAARTALPDGWTLGGATAATGPAMILDEAALAASAAAVLRLGMAARADGIVVAAFGDPGVADLRARLSAPVAGIGEAALREAGADGRRFGIATTTPGLRAAMEAAVRFHGLDRGFTGIRLAAGEPLRLAGDPGTQDAALRQAATTCVTQDGAEAVVIGGGPLSASAAALAATFPVPVIEPVPAAVRSLRGMLRVR